MRLRLILILIILINFVFYLPALKCFFAADDWYQIEKRSNSVVLSTFYGDWHKGDRGTGGFFRPLIRISFHLERKLFDLNPIGYHLTNIFFHLLTVSILFLLIIKITDSVFLAWFTTTIFSIFPTHTEPIFWISARTDIISTCFLLFALFFWVSFLSRTKRNPSISGIQELQSPTEFSPGPLLFLSIFMFILALLSKEISIVFLFIAPIFLLRKILDNKAVGKRDLISFAVFCLIGVIYFLYRNEVLGGLGGYTFRGKIFTLSAIRQTYRSFLFTLINPISGTIPFLRPILSFSIISICGFLILFFLRFPFFPLLGLWWIFVSILPMASLTVSPESGGRFLYLPSIGFCIFIASVIHYLFLENRDKKINLKNVGYFMIGITFSVYLLVGKIGQYDWIESGLIARNTLKEIQGIVADEYYKNQNSKVGKVSSIVFLNPRERVGTAHLFQGWSIMQAVWVYLEDKDLPCQVGLRNHNDENSIFIYFSPHNVPQRIHLKKKEEKIWRGEDLLKWEIPADKYSINKDVLSVKADGGKNTGIVSPTIELSEKGLGLLRLVMSVKEGGGYTGQVWLLKVNDKAERYLGTIYNDFYNKFVEHNIDIGWVEGRFQLRILPSSPLSDFEIKEIEYYNFIFDEKIAKDI